MKIAMVVAHCHKHGGHEIANEHEVHIFANTLGDLNNNSVIFHKVPILKKPPLVELGSFIFNSTVRLIGRHFDIIHSQGSNAIVQNVITNHTTLAAKLEALGHVEENERQGVAYRIHDRIYYAFLLKIEAIIYSPKSNRRVVAVSEGVRREIAIHYGKPIDEITVVHNGVDLERFHPGNRALHRKEIREQLHLTSEDFVVLFVGGDWWRKGLQFAIRALALIDLNRLKLLIVGDWRRDEYVELAKDLKISERVIFAGKSTEVQKYYAASDIFLLPSFYEAFSLGTLEAAASGLPLLVTKINGTEELVQEGYNGYFISRDPSEIAEKIKLLMSDPYLLKSTSGNARKSAEDYSWDKAAQKLVRVYEEVAKVRRNP
jgi:UDP-glucose:(heptosyl)LPS alpha-1,3-glucosyltransferase